MAVFAADGLTGLRVRDQTLQCLPGCDMGLPGITSQPPLPLSAMSRQRMLGDRLSLPRSDDEQTRTGLRYAIVCGVEHLRWKWYPALSISRTRRSYAGRLALFW
jgi:hypothetical protein